MHSNDIKYNGGTIESIKTDSLTEHAASVKLFNDKKYFLYVEMSKRKVAEKDKTIIRFNEMLQELDKRQNE